MENKDIEFIAKHYNKGKFDRNSAWNKFKGVPVARWKKYRVAAAAAAIFVLSATAAIIYNEFREVDTPQPIVQTFNPSPLAEVKVIDFENASLADVIYKIETVYDVRVENLPAPDSEYKLSLHYEGTPTDLISIINDILGTQMTVTEK